MFESGGGGGGGGGGGLVEPPCSWCRTARAIGAATHFLAVSFPSVNNNDYNS